MFRQKSRGGRHGTTGLNPSDHVGEAVVSGVGDGYMDEASALRILPEVPKDVNALFHRLVKVRSRKDAAAG